MALNNNVELKSGIKVDGAYVKVANIEIKGKTELKFVVKYFVDEHHSTDNKEFNKKTFYANYDLDSEDNAIQQAYSYLKTLKEFENSIDC